MKEQEVQYCPLFPDLICPRGPEAARECTVRVNGNFDPVMYFKDHLVMHCALHRSQQELEKANR
jgi:hypothetical protein